MRNYRLYDEVLLRKQLTHTHIITEKSNCSIKNIIIDRNIEIGVKATIVKIFSFYNAFTLRFLIDGKILYCNVDKKYIL